MIDVHSHLLPEVDDGSPSLAVTRQMLQTAWSEGIRTVIATPHYHPIRGKNDLQSWSYALGLAQQEASAIDSRMRVLPGCEILYQQDVVDKLLAGELWTIAGTRYVLIEFSTSSGASFIRNSMLSLRQYGYIPILAHAERYPSLADPDKICELAELGVCIQVNANTVLRCSGLIRGRLIRTLLKKQYIHFIGTDAHNTKERPPHMRECRDYISRLCGKAYADEVCMDNARRMLRDERIL